MYAEPMPFVRELLVSSTFRHTELLYAIEDWKRLDAIQEMKTRSVVKFSMCKYRTCVDDYTRFSDRAPPPPPSRSVRVRCRIGSKQLVT